MYRMLFSMLFLMALNINIFASQIMLNGGVSVGNGYNSGFVSLLKQNDNFFDFGLDISVFNFQDTWTAERNYYGSVYTQNKFYEKYGFSSDLILGVTFSKLEYEADSTGFTTAPGVGLAGRYEFSPKWKLEAKSVASVYSDGITVPYNVGLVYSLSRIDVGVGLQGILITLTGDDADSSNTSGFMISLKY
ncbi:MAG: hypothetical protein JW871_07425 [Endomicrobiales bacterium]|nr:hypothetical protein [Endomicrobiales bacterium]